jgi:hypothetical protein
MIIIKYEVRVSRNYSNIGRSHPNNKQYNMRALYIPGILRAADLARLEHADARMHEALRN